MAQFNNNLNHSPTVHDDISVQNSTTQNVLAGYPRRMSKHVPKFTKLKETSIIDFGHRGDAPFNAKKIKSKQ